MVKREWSCRQGSDSKSSPTRATQALLQRNNEDRSLRLVAFLS